MKIILILILATYLLVLLQTSFLPHFHIFGVSPNLTLILIVFISFFEKPSSKTSLLAVIFSGFFLDVFSQNNLGTNIVVLLVLAFFIKGVALILSKKESILWFLLFFILSFLFYELFFNFLNQFLEVALKGTQTFQFTFKISAFFTALFYNLILASLGFILTKNVYQKFKKKRV